MKKILYLLLLSIFICTPSYAKRLDEMDRNTSPDITNDFVYSQDVSDTSENSHGTGKSLTIKNAFKAANITIDGTNVGINSVNPTTTLDVVGTVNATAFTGDGSGLTGISGVSTGDGGWTDGGSNVYNTTSTDNVGIGTPTPTEKLEVIGTVKATTFSGSGDGLTDISSKSLKNPVLELTMISPDGRREADQNVWESKSIVTLNNKQYAGFWNNDSTSHLELCSRVLSTADWTCYAYDGTGGRANISISSNSIDDHRAVYLGIDPNGFIHVVYDSHTSTLRYRTSSSPEDISSLSSTKSMVGTNETAVTYTIFFRDRDGKLFFMFRDGSSGNGDHYLYSYDETTTTWSAATGTSTGGLFIDGKNSSPVTNPYISVPYVDANNVAHFWWTWENSGVQDDIVYVSYNLTTGVFLKSDTSAQTIPITRANCDTAVDITGSTDVDLLSGIERYGPAVDTTGNIFIPYARNDADGYSQLYYVKHTFGGSWETPVQLTNDTELYSINYRISHAFIDVNNKIYFIIRTKNPSSGYQVFESTDGFTTYNKYMLYNGPVGANLFINFDDYEWITNNELYLIFHPSINAGLQTVADSGTAKDMVLSNRPIYLLHWSPLQGHYQADQSLQNGFESYDDLAMISHLGTVFLGGNLVWLSGKTTFVDENHSIATAISQAASGDTIKLGKGTWTECLDITKSIRIVGSSRESSTITCNDPDEDTIYVTASNVSISDLTLNNTGGGSGSDVSRGIIFDGTGTTVRTGETVQNVKITVTGGSTTKVEGIRFNDSNGYLNDIDITATSTYAATSMLIGMTGASTAESSMTVNAYRINATIDAQSTVRGINVTDSSSPSPVIFNGYNVFITATENGTSATTGASTNSGTDAEINLYNSRISGADTDVNNGGGGIFSLNNTVLVNNTLSGSPFTFSGTSYNTQGYFDSNVGIGTLSPSTNLHVVGDARITGLVSCDTIDTDSSGNLSCGTDSGTGGGIADIVEDTTPQLGGDLDLNTHNLDFPTTANISDVLDEDNMASDSATKLATQQSIKAYVDTAISGVGGASGWTDGGANVVLTTTTDNVGIGTTTAGAKLVVGTSGQFSLTSAGALTLTGSQTITDSTGSGNAFAITKNSQSSGSAIAVSSSSASASGVLASFTQSGANYTGNTVSITQSGSSSTGVALLVNKSGTSSTGPAVRVTNAGTGYTVQFEDSSSDTTPFVIDNSGNVGVGTIAPSTNLHVVGGARITGLVSCDTIDTDSNGVLSCGTDASGGGDTSGWTDGGTSVLLTTTTDNVGIGTTTIQGGKLNVGGGYVRVGVGGTNTNATSAGELYVQGDLEVDGTLYPNVISGHVIGTDLQAWDADLDSYAGVTPTASWLEVLNDTTADDQVLVFDSSSAGTMRSISDCQDSGGNHLNYNASTNSFSCGTSASGSGGWTDGGTNVYTTTTTDTVGIGTTTPASSTTLEIVKQSSNAPFKISASASGNGNYFVVNSAGNVGIGTTSALNTKLTVNGDIVSLGSGASYTTGNLGVGTTLPQALLAVGTTGGFQVNSSGRVLPRVNTTTSSATPAINTDTTDIFTITALATNITSMTSSLTGTPVVGQKLIIAIKDNGTSRSITWGASFASTTGATLPTATTINKTTFVGLIPNLAGTVWTCVAVTTES